MAHENSRIKYATHPFYQCLKKLGIKADSTLLQEIVIEPSVHMDDFIALLLDQQGIQYSAVAIYDETSLESLTPPCILHWNLNHFVIVTRIDQAGLQVWDPYLGECQYSCMEFMELCRKPGYVNCAISLAASSLKQEPAAPSPLTRLLQQEKSEERILIKVLTPLAFALSYIGKPATRFIMHWLVAVWDTLAKPRIFSGPQRNYQRFLNLEPAKARRQARKNIAELAINMGYTGFLLNKIKTPRTTDWADRVVAMPLSDNSARFKGQCIVELMHLFDPISAVYSTIKQLPADRNFVVYGNPWDESMIALCEQTCRDHGRTLEIIPPSEKHSFLKLMKRAKSGDHIIMFADGNPLFASDQASGLQLARSFSACELWQHKAYMTLTGAVLARKVSANLYLAGLTQHNGSVFAVHALPAQGKTLSEIMQYKAAAAEGLLEQSPHGWLFWRNADVYFHEYQPVIGAKSL